MTTLRQHLEAIRDEAEHLPAPRLVTSQTQTIYGRAIAALQILNDSHEMSGAAQTDRYRVVIDDPGRTPDMRPRSAHHA